MADLDGRIEGWSPGAEAVFGWLQEGRAIATRFEKRAVPYLGMLKPAMIRKYLKPTLSNTA